MEGTWLVCKNNPSVTIQPEAAKTLKEKLSPDESNPWDKLKSRFLEVFKIISQEIIPPTNLKLMVLIH